MDATLESGLYCFSFRKIVKNLIPEWTVWICILVKSLWYYREEQLKANNFIFDWKVLRRHCVRGTDERENGRSK